jgi:hypothetical protein
VGFIVTFTSGQPPAMSSKPRSRADNSSRGFRKSLPAEVG